MYLEIVQNLSIQHNAEKKLQIILQLYKGNCYLSNLYLNVKKSYYEITLHAVCDISRIFIYAIFNIHSNMVLLCKRRKSWKNIIFYIENISERCATVAIVAGSIIQRDGVLHVSRIAH